MPSNRGIVITYPCAVCAQHKRLSQLVSFSATRPQVSEFLARKIPDRWIEGARICVPCLRNERFSYIIERMAQERGALSALEKDVAQRATSHTAIAEDLERSFIRKATFGERVADKVANHVGSWTFIITFLVVLMGWFFVNTAMLNNQGFDPYPYILLNLVLSCIAALQAPLIMMSQNRLAERDRVRAEHDFRINLKAELEIGSLHEKLDHLLHNQWQRMVELQEIQIDLLTDRGKK